MMDEDMNSSGMERLEIGILGVGNLAGLMVEQFVGAGFSVNVLQAQRENLACSNVRLHHSVVPLVKTCSVIITIMSDAPELENVFFGDEGIVQFVRAGSVVIDMSSVSPEFLQELSEQLVEREISFLDAALINEDKGESEAIQMILVGGDSSVYEKALPVLEKIADSVRRMGENGASQFYRQAFAVRKKTQ